MISYGTLTGCMSNRVSGSNWWIRSPNTGNTNNVNNVNSSGGLNNNNASNSNAFSPDR